MTDTGSTIIDGATYDSTVTYREDAKVVNSSYTSTGTDENAIVVEGGTVDLDQVTVKRDSTDSAGGDDASFYGVGAAILAKGGTANISNATITTDARGGAGAFAYGEGVINISDSTITTSQDTAGGIHVAGGGTLYATDITATTQGESSAAIRSDRGGGLMVIEDGTYTSNGVGSPAIYCTANIVVKDAELAANASEAVCIEGLNSLYLYDCNLTGTMGDSAQNDCTWNVILYQSMSGDSQVGNSTFQMTGGTLTANNGGMFYTTNTESTFLLQNVEITPAEDNAFFLRCTGNQNQRGWGKVGSNGADCTFTARDQKMTGDVVWDSISTLDFYALEGSTLTGAFVQDESCAGSGSDGTATLSVDASSTWIITGDSTLTTLHCAGEIEDADGNTVTIKGTDGTTFVDGPSDYSITVASYDTNVDASGAGSITDFEDAQVNTGYSTSDIMSGGPGGGNGGMPPDAPGNDGLGNGGTGNGGTPPEKPSGEDAPPEKPDDEGAPPAMPGGDSANSGDAPPDAPNGNGMGGGTPPEKPNGEMSPGTDPSEPPQNDGSSNG